MSYGGEGSGYLQGDIIDPAMRSTEDFVNAQQKVKQANDVDAAIRGGVGEIEDNGGSAYYSPRLAPPSPQEGFLANIGTPTPGNGPAPPVGGGFTAPPPGAATSGNAAIGRVESSGGTGWAPNKTYQGTYQFGPDALKDIGVFQPQPTAMSLGAGGTTNVWQGKITVPGYDPMSPQDFFNNPDAQSKAMDMRREWITNWLHSTGLDAHQGQQIGGVDMSPDMMVALTHFAGPGNFQRWLTSDGAYQWKDGNGVTIPQYAERIAGGGFSSSGQSVQGGQTTVPGQPASFQDASAAAPAAAPGFAPNPSFNARYDPILSRLASTPGGGATALTILGQQSRYDMGMTKRQDTYARMGMTALAKGDMVLAQQFLPMAGLNVPPALLQNEVMRQRFGAASLAAERLYGQDRAGAQRFVQSYLQTGDLAGALTQAGPPASQAHMSVQQMYDVATNTWRVYGIPTTGPNAGQAQPVTLPGQGGQQLAGGPHPTPEHTQVVPVYGEGGTTNYTGVKTSGPQAGTAAPIMVPGQGGQPATPLVGQPKPSGAEQGMLAKQHILQMAGYDAQTAAAIAGGSGLRPADAVRAYTAVLGDLMKDPAADGMKAQQQAAQIMEQQFGPNWRGTPGPAHTDGFRTNGPIQSTAPSATAAPPASTPQAPHPQGGGGLPPGWPPNAPPPQAFQGLAPGKGRGFRNGVWMLQNGLPVMVGPPAPAAALPGA